MAQLLVFSVKSDGERGWNGERLMETKAWREVKLICREYVCCELYMLGARVSAVMEGNKTEAVCKQASHLLFLSLTRGSVEGNIIWFPLLSVSVLGWWRDWVQGAERDKR